MKTKLDATEKVLHPNKKELYRHTERVIVFRSWMRIAAAVILVLFGSLFFLLNKKENVVTDGRVAVKPKVTTPVTTEKNNPVEKLIEKSLPSNEETSVAQTTENKVQPKKDKTLSPTDNKVDVNNIQQPLTTNDPSLAQQQPRKREVIQFDVKRFTTQPEIGEIGVKETLAHNNVTSPITASYNDQEGTQEPADPSGDFKNTKRSSAKGLFRKVTRFIGRNTGIGVADKDADEVLIGAVALKLK
ncbi:MAG: hypothetical protein EON98_08505 [Chitinophagaceae bacterium]|nr:MAG: hypothetical protein EON98_08505 [Chitinophagaceae bacterium]